MSGQVLLTNVRAGTAGDLLLLSNWCPEVGAFVLVEVLIIYWFVQNCSSTVLDRQLSSRVQLHAVCGP